MRRRFTKMQGAGNDFVLIDAESGTVESYKTLTTPDAPSRAVLEGWQALLERTGASGSEVETAIHGTTLITNALIERKGAVTALVTTSGFSDVLDTQAQDSLIITNAHRINNGEIFFGAKISHVDADGSVVAYSGTDKTTRLDDSGPSPRVVAARLDTLDAGNRHIPTDRYYRSDV